MAQGEITLHLKRKFFGAAVTLGDLFINEDWFAYTLEDKRIDFKNGKVDKIAGQTAIPEGEYVVMVEFSHHFQRRLPHIHNVPYFEGILIHGGNRPADTRGCVLIGADSNGSSIIWECADKVDALVEMIDNAKETKIIIS